ncbi:Abi family protein [Porphyrobacter sp. SLTP]|uniref:Abi family protein n=1 Tax=Porphyrobacter sp. SLTP TaxID=2683266 RepID=UPI0018F8C39B|nr:Abi family protein [Porphyrobacter sp. SLTP]
MPEAYNKTFLTIDQQIAKLKSRLLPIDDDADASAKLEHYGYYRLSGYWHCLRKFDLLSGAALDDFREGTTLSHAIELLEFDCRLRAAFQGAAEKIEIALRVQIAILLGAQDPWAHRQPDKLYSGFTSRIDPRTGTIPYNEWISKLDQHEARSKEQFAVHFREKYLQPPPIWVSIELWDFGMLSRLIGGLTVTDQKALGQKYGLARRELLPSWVRSINHIRNVAAHHSRLWNRSPADQPVPPKAGELPELDHLANDNFALVRLYGIAAPMQYLLRQIDPSAASEWAEKLKLLMPEFPAIPGVPVTQTGFPTGWEQLALWN